MCVGLPMRIVETTEGSARCEGMGVSRSVDTLLVGPQPIGTWLLIHQQSAREVLSEAQASSLTNALQALDQIMGGELAADQAQPMLDTMFADLIANPAPKPPSLLALEQQRQRTQPPAGDDCTIAIDIAAQTEAQVNTPNE